MSPTQLRSFNDHEFPSADLQNLLTRKTHDQMLLEQGLVIPRSLACPNDPGSPITASEVVATAVNTFPIMFILCIMTTDSPVQNCKL